jgi:antitoxin component of MazEF toxin-antitoxin module
VAYVDSLTALDLNVCDHKVVREIVKLRTLAGAVVVSLPQSVLEPVGLKAGDRVVVEAAPPRRLIVTKEGNTMTSTARLELEIDLLDKKRAAIDSDLVYKQEQHNKDTPCEPEMTDSDLIGLVFYKHTRDRDRIEVEIAEKRIELYDLQAGAVQPA